MVQSLIELSPPGNSACRDARGADRGERSLLESISNHVGMKGAVAQANQQVLGDDEGKWTATGVATGADE